MIEWYIFIVYLSILSVISLPNRLELSFFIVFALPNTYRIGSHCNTLSYRLEAAF